MITVNKIEINYVGAAQPLDLCLEIWLEWQRLADMDIGWNRRSAIMASDSYADSEQLYGSMDTATAEAVEAMMAGLPRHLDWAIRKQCGIATVWRFPNLDFASALVEARDALAKKLKNNIATRSFFL